MEGLNRLKINTEELISRYLTLKKKNIQLENNIEQMEKDVSFLENNHHQIPEIVLKNRKLLEGRDKATEKVDNIIKRLDKIC